MSQSNDIDGFPKLTTHSSMMANIIKSDPNLYYENAKINTSAGYSFDAHIQIGIDNPDEITVECGAVCLEEDSYKSFSKFFNNLILASQGCTEPERSIYSQVSHRLNSLDLEDYRDSIDSVYIKEVKIQTRRNISGFNFSPKISRAETRKIFTLMSNALYHQYPEVSQLAHLDDISMDQKKELQAANMFLERPDPKSFCALSGGKGEWPDGRGIFSTPNFFIWINEEDHVRMFAKSSPDKVNIVDILEELIKCEFLLEKALLETGGCCFMHHPHFGYLTTCPTKLGGLEIEVVIKTIAIAFLDDKSCSSNALSRLCNSFGVDILPRHDIDRDGRSFEIKTRPTILLSEYDRIRRFLSCIQAITLLDEYAVLHDVTSLNDFVSTIMPTPESPLAPSTSQESRKAVRIVSPFSKNHTSAEVIQSTNQGSCSFCCPSSLPYSQHNEIDIAQMVSDPMNPMMVQSPTTYRKYGVEQTIEVSQRQLSEKKRLIRQRKQYLFPPLLSDPSQSRNEESPSLSFPTEECSLTVVDTEKIDQLKDFSDFPNFPRGAKSLLSRYLTPEIYQKYQHKRTYLSGCSLCDIILPGIENPELRIGVIAGDEECYELFCELFDPIITSLHKFTPGSTHQLRDAQTMKLGGILGIDMSYVMTARVKASRNIRGYPLAPMITRADRRKLERLLKNTLERLNGPLKGNYYSLDKLTVKQIAELDAKQIYIDPPENCCSRCNRDWPDGRGIFISDTLNFIVLTNHLDHLQIISCDDGGDMINAFEQWAVGMMLIEGVLNCTSFTSTPAYSKERKNKGEIGEEEKEVESVCDFQYNDRIGYIACSPQNLGTGMYSSLTVKLPHLLSILQEESLKKICKNMGLHAVRMEPALSLERMLVTEPQEESLGFELSKLKFDILETKESDEGRQDNRGIRSPHKEWIEEDREEEEEEEREKSKRDKPEEPRVGDNSRLSGAAVYEIRNRDCMGQSEVQLTQKVIDGAAAVIEIEKKTENGASVEEFLPVPMTPPLPAPPQCSIYSSTSQTQVVPSLSTDNNTGLANKSISGNNLVGLC